MNRVYYYLVLMFLVCIFPLRVNAYSTQTFTFIKTDEQGNYINDAEFKVHSLDGSVEYSVLKSVEILNDKVPTPMSTIRLAAGDIIPDGQYFVSLNKSIDYNQLLNILGPEERQILEDLKDYSKHEEYTELFDQSFASEYAELQVTRGIHFWIEHVCGKTPSPQLGTNTYSPSKMVVDEEETKVGCYRLLISVPVLMVLEETKAPVGLKKEKAIINVIYLIEYSFDEEDNNNFVRVENTYAEKINGFYKYNYDLDYSNVLDLARKQITSTNDEELYFKNDCEEYYKKSLNVGLVLRSPTPSISAKYYSPTKMNDACLDMPVIIDHENGAVLTISSYVNNGGSTRAIKGSKIDYKVVVKNEGTGSSTNNVITSKIPEGFKYVEGSASDNGVYLESSNAVIWNINEIEVESTKELTYKVSVSEDVDLDKVYISTATVMNDGSDEIISNETRVTLEGLVNPKTGEFNSIIVLFVLSVIGLIGYYLIDRKTVVSL